MLNHHLPLLNPMVTLSFPLFSPPKTVLLLGMYLIQNTMDQALPVAGRRKHAAPKRKAGLRQES